VFHRNRRKLTERKGLPVLIAIAGQTAAGKTEIVSRLYVRFESSGKRVTSIEMDNFFTDRDYREEHGIDSRGMEALHYALFKQALTDIMQWKTGQLSPDTILSVLLPATIWMAN
jgi:uridine kinase